MTKKGVSLALGVIIIIVIGVILLLILSIMFSSQIGRMSQRLEGITNVYEFCKKLYQNYYYSTDPEHKAILAYFFSDPTYVIQYTDERGNVVPVKRGICKKYAYILGVDSKAISGYSPSTHTVSLCPAGTTGHGCVTITMELALIIYYNKPYFLQQ